MWHTIVNFNRVLLSKTWARMKRIELNGFIFDARVGGTFCCSLLPQNFTSLMITGLFPFRICARSYSVTLYVPGI